MTDFKMPSLGADMDSGTLVEWKIKVGDRVKKGDLVATVETVKGAIEIEIFLDGVVEELLVPVDATVPVDAVLARIRTEGAAAQASAAAAPVAAAPAPAPPPAPTVAPAPPGHRMRASPVARKLAAERCVDLARVQGSGPQGAIVREDVERFAGSAGPPPPPAAPARAAKAGFDTAAMRAAIAAAMSRSKREIPHYYLSTEVDLGHALAWLEQRNAGRSVAERVLAAALLLKAAALAAREVPEVNGHCVDGTFVPAESVHLGVAINLRAGGLVAPALRDAQALGVPELMARLTDLVERARRGGLKSSELGSATLTVTNLGDQGVSSVFPVIHPPQVAMVGFGKVVTRPWVVDGLMGPRPIVVASLAADHRVSDGHRGARYLAAIERLLQTPEAL